LTINDNLAAQAQTYFSSVFMGKDNEDVLPEGWKFAKVGDYCIENIANLSKSDAFNTILYLDTGSITDNYIFEVQELNLSTDEIPSRAKRKTMHGDIIYSTVRPNLRHYGLLQNPPDNLIVSTGFAVLHNKGLEVSNYFLFMWLTTKSILEYLQAIAENSVSTYPSLNVSDLLNVEIIVPDDITLANINHFLTSIFSSISENNRQIKMLTSSLSTLLPKLLSSR
jgi:Type I restriction modification DNA specificity domain.